jgi:tRNA nucleotidyltransferase (CCA-adding enzyme)
VKRSSTPNPQAQIPNLKSKVAARLPAAYQQALAVVVEEAQHSGIGVYLVGGFVRDLLLDHPNLDLDIAVEDDAIALATAVAVRLADAAVTSPNSKLRADAIRPYGNSKLLHPQFGTATVQQDAPPMQLDFATTRQETYAQPAALPTVSFVADIATDLRRRDFTINALAIRLADYTLVDPYGGLADLSAGLIRVLHPASFFDDPTRIFRAVRYEQRLGFAIEPATLSLLRDAVSDDFIDRLSPDRVRHELEKIWREERAPAMLTRLAELGILTAVASALRWDEQLRHQTEAVAFAESPAARPLLYLLLLTYRLSDVEQQRLSNRLNLNADTLSLMRQAHQLREHLPDLLHAARPSETYRLLHPYPDLVLLAITYALAPYSSGSDTAFATMLEKINLYRRELAGIKPELRGDYLAALGLPPGKAYKPILDELRRAKLDGEAPTREAEAALLRWLVAQAKGE